MLASRRRKAAGSSQRVGSKRMGSGKASLLRCMIHELMLTTVPAGTKWPLNVSPDSGTSRGRRPGTPNERLPRLVRFELWMESSAVPKALSDDSRLVFR
jgi:hypothetical protein